MKPIIEKLCAEWAEAEQKLRTEIEKLDSWGCECSCGWDNEEEQETTYFIHDGKWPELMNTCLTCGGYVNE